MNYANISAAGPTHDIKYTASYSCRNLATNNVTSYPLSYNRNLTGGEHTVRATKWVIVNKPALLWGTFSAKPGCPCRGFTMARLNDDAQWIILMGFLISFSLFFLAIVINQSTVVGQTTAESVIEFPKNDIRDVRNVIGEAENLTSNSGFVKEDIKFLSMQRKSSVVDYNFTTLDNTTYIQIHYNNGVTEYNENWTLP